MGYFAVRKKKRIRKMNPPTANSANGVLIRDVASVSIRVDTTKTPTIYPNHYINKEQV
jgi:hypothetical protein